MRALLLTCALLAPLVASAQSGWTFQENIEVPLAFPRASGIHGVALDTQGRLWVQHHLGTERLIYDGVPTTVQALYVFNTDGTQAPCSPIKYIENAAGTVIDTLGYFTNATGAGEARTGRGITADASGNMLVSQFDMLYLFDSNSCTVARDSSIVQLASAQPAPGASLTGAGVDAFGNAYVATVVPGTRPLYGFGPALTPAQNVSDRVHGIGRDLEASMDGTLVFDHAFTEHGTVVHYRSNTFAPFDSVGITLRGLAIESSGYQPVADLYWFSSGPGGAIPPNTDPNVVTNYQAHSWYGYAIDDLVTRDGTGMVTGTVENPTPRDSIIVTAEEWGTTVAGPRGIAFTDDGQTVYLGHFGAPMAMAIKRYTRSGVAVGNGPEDGGLALGQNRPNPFMGETEITFSLETPGNARLRVFDVTGREVANLVDRSLSAGPHAVMLDASSLAPGVYVYTLEFEGRLAQRRMSVVR